MNLSIRASNTLMNYILIKEYPFKKVDSYSILKNGLTVLFKSHLLITSKKTMNNSHQASRGPLTITLNHISGNSYSRDMRTFRMHGDKRHGVRGFASEGCIIMGPATRLLVSKDHGATLEVVR